MSFLSDIRRAFRSLFKARGFASAVILTLALGIGANTAMFTLLRGTLLRPLPNRQGERLVYLRQSAKGVGQDNVNFSVPEIVDYRSASKTLGSIGEFSSMTFTMVEGDEPVHVQAGIVSLTGALVTTGLLRGLLFGVAPHDPITLGGVAFLLAAIGVLACLLPAVRAAKVDPAVALRSE